MCGAQTSHCGMMIMQDLSLRLGESNLCKYFINRFLTYKNQKDVSIKDFITKCCILAIYVIVGFECF